MSQFLFLDSGPLGLLTHPQRTAEVVGVAEWLSRSLLRGSRVIVPTIVYYEVKRELLRTKKSFGVGRLDAFIAATPGGTYPCRMKRSGLPPTCGRVPGRKDGPPLTRTLWTSM